MVWVFFGLNLHVFFHACSGYIKCKKRKKEEENESFCRTWFPSMAIWTENLSSHITQQLSLEEKHFLLHLCVKICGENVIITPLY